MTKIFIKTYQGTPYLPLIFHDHLDTYGLNDFDTLSYYNNFFQKNSMTIQLSQHKFNQLKLDVVATDIYGIYLLSQSFVNFLYEQKICASIFQTQYQNIYLCIFNFYDILLKKESGYCENSGDMIFPVFKNTSILGYDKTIESGQLLISSDIIQLIEKSNLRIQNGFYPVSFCNGETTISSFSKKYDQNGIWSNLSDYLKKHQLPESLNPYT